MESKRLIKFDSKDEAEEKGYNVLRSPLVVSSFFTRGKDKEFLDEIEGIPERAEAYVVGVEEVKTRRYGRIGAVYVFEFYKRG